MKKFQIILAGYGPEHTSFSKSLKIMGNKLRSPEAQAHPITGGKQIVCENWRNLISVGAKPLAITN